MIEKSNTFIKDAENSDVDMRCEASALRWLSAAESLGGIRITHVISVNKQKLVEEYIPTSAPTSDAAYRIGAALAHMHASGAHWYGCPPDDWDFTWGQGYVIANSLTPVVPYSQATKSWGAYYAESLIMGYARKAFDQAVFDKRALSLIERVASRLQDGIYDAAEPGLVEQAIASSKGTIACARLHGDLWAGNVLWGGSAASTTGGVLIDPMAHGGHAESDLAMLQLFGFPYLDEVVEGYNEVSPLADGWRERVALHQLAPLLHHCVLFGGGYVSSALNIAGHYA